MTSALSMTAMEKEILSVFHDEYASAGFPAVERIEVVRRINTGSGRRVMLCSESRIALDDGYHDMAGRYIEIDEVKNGMMAVVSVVANRLEELEISTYGDTSWSGSEEKWAIG